MKIYLDIHLTSYRNFWKTGDILLIHRSDIHLNHFTIELDFDQIGLFYHDESCAITNLIEEYHIVLILK
jgi:hypothetical protein